MWKPRKRERTVGHGADVAGSGRLRSVFRRLSSLIRFPCSVVCPPSSILRHLATCHVVTLLPATRRVRGAQSSTSRQRVSSWRAMRSIWAASRMRVLLPRTALGTCLWFTTVTAPRAFETTNQPGKARIGFTGVWMPVCFAIHFWSHSASRTACSKPWRSSPEGQMSCCRHRRPRDPCSRAARDACAGSWFRSPPLLKGRRPHGRG